MWVQLAIIAGQIIFGELSRIGVFSSRPHKTSFEEFKKDNGPSEIRPVAYVAGTEEVIPSRIWFGDFKQRAVERDSQWSDYLFFGFLAALLDTLTVGHRYYIGEVFSLCYGPDAHIEQIKIQDRLMYQSVIGADNAGGSFLIDDPQAWGGDQPPGEGGQYSLCDLTRGNYTDPANAYLVQMLGVGVPALYGISLLVSRGPSGFLESGFFAAGGIGSTPRFKEWKVTIRRQPNNLGTIFSKIGRHANPMEVWYEHATSFEYGARCPTPEINLTSFQSTAEQLHTEGLGWSGKIEDPTTARNVCKNIEAQCDLVMDPSPSLGLTARLIRRDYSIGSLPVLNKDNVTKIEKYAPGAYEDTINKIIIPFGDQDNNFRQRPGIYIDPANQRIQSGRIAPKTQEYDGVADYETANMLATRDGRAAAIPRPPLTLWCMPSFGKLRYRGEAIKFSWTNPTFSKIFRITSVQKGTAKNPDYRLVLIEDQFATGLRTFGEPAGTGFTDPGAGLNVAPPSATWDTALLPPDGLQTVIIVGNGGELHTSISGAIIFGSYAPGGQFARIWVTEPGGTQTLSPLRLIPDDNNKAEFNWPVLVEGEYGFCIQTFSIRLATNGSKVCADIDVVFSESGANAVTINGIVVTQNGEVMTGGW